MRQTTRLLAAAVLISLATLAGCSSDPTPAPSGSAGPSTSTPTVSGPVGPPTPASSTTTGPGSGGTGPGATPQPPAQLPTVTLTRTGGMAGVSQMIVISSDGSWVYTDRRAGTTSRGHLSAAQTTQLAQLLAGMATVTVPRSTGPCADGYVYTIGVGEVTRTVNQCAAGSLPAVNAVLAFVTAATPL